MLRHEYEAANTWPKMVWQIIKPATFAVIGVAVVAFVPILGVMALFGNAYILQTSYVFAGVLWAMFMFMSYIELDSWFSHRKDNGAAVVTLQETINNHRRIFCEFREDSLMRWRKYEDAAAEFRQSLKHLDERLDLHEKAESDLVERQLPSELERVHKALGIQQAPQPVEPGIYNRMVKPSPLTKPTPQPMKLLTLEQAEFIRAHNAPTVDADETLRPDPEVPE